MSPCVGFAQVAPDCTHRTSFASDLRLRIRALATTCEAEASDFRVSSPSTLSQPWSQRGVFPAVSCASPANQLRGLSATKHGHMDGAWCLAVHPHRRTSYTSWV